MWCFLFLNDDGTSKYDHGYPVTENGTHDEEEEEDRKAEEEEKEQEKEDQEALEREELQYGGDDDYVDDEPDYGQGPKRYAVKKRSFNNSTTCGRWQRPRPIATHSGAHLRLSGHGMESAGYLSSQSSSESALVAREIDIQTPTGIILWVVAIMLMFGISLSLGAFCCRFGPVWKAKLKARKQRKRRERQQRDLEAAAKRRARATSTGATTLVNAEG